MGEAQRCALADGFGGKIANLFAEDLPGCED